MTLRDIGQLVVYAGPMFSGKSEEYLRLRNNHERAHIKALYLKPQTDTRKSKNDDPNLVESRAGLPPQRAVRVDPKQPEQILELADGHRAVFVDEIHFFAPHLAEVLHYIAHGRDREVYAFGLDRDFRDVPFEVTARLMGYADDVKKMPSVCTKKQGQMHDCYTNARCTTRVHFGTTIPTHYKGERIIPQPALVCNGEEAPVVADEKPPEFDYIATCYDHNDMPGRPSLDEIIARDKRRQELMLALEKQLDGEGFK